MAAIDATIAQAMTSQVPAPTPEEVAFEQQREAIHVEIAEITTMREAADMLEASGHQIEHLKRVLEVEQARTSTLDLVAQLFNAGRGGMAMCDASMSFGASVQHTVTDLRRFVVKKNENLTAISQEYRKAAVAAMKGPIDTEVDIGDA